MLVAEFHSRAVVCRKLLRTAGKLWRFADRSRLVVRARLRGASHQYWRDLQSRGADGGFENAAAGLARPGDESRYRQVGGGANQRSRTLRARAVARPVAWRGETDRADWKGRRQSAGDADRDQHAGRELEYRGLCRQQSRASSVSFELRVIRAPAFVDHAPTASLSLFVPSYSFIAANGFESHRRLARKRSPSALSARLAS